MSTSDPWTADRHLDVALAERAVSAAVPELRPVTARLLGWGWDFDAYEVNETWVFRFPRRTGEQERLQKDLALLAWLQSCLDVPLPRYRWGALRADCFPYVFSGYRKLVGEQAAAFDPRALDLDVLGGRLGTFFRELHALQPPADLVREAGLEGKSADPHDLREWMRKYLPAFQGEAPRALTSRAERFFDQARPVPCASSAPPKLVHNDLHAEHLLLDPEAPETITGLLDWSDTRLSDPAAEFAAIYTWGGEALLAPVLDAYGGSEPGLAERARFLGLCLAFQDWSYWMRVDRASWAERPLRVLEEGLP